MERGIFHQTDIMKYYEILVSVAGQASTIGTINEIRLERLELAGSSSSIDIPLAGERPQNGWSIDRPSWAQLSSEKPGSHEWY